ncbi:hypothetical protein DPMN_033246 [Dreissena polymorpha]|uniref:Uncharacterized protein n=1 Tax=Dreissena polymorpha TaxID=45954 RepID=A0A9D4M5P3_DREPO|nr:hypothetical protein DPMN_033246 [Dreissena polymorpha]
MICFQRNQAYGKYGGLGTNVQLTAVKAASACAEGNVLFRMKEAHALGAITNR